MSTEFSKNQANSPPKHMTFGTAPNNKHEATKLMLRTSLIILLVVFSSGCWNSDNAREIDFGDVSIGVQLTDLKRALDEGAITPEEHAKIKKGIIDTLVNDHESSRED